jgi:prepilin-type N-terminal cleavage/methylation domain-containing protein
MRRLLKGFTLIEMLAVIAIILILASLSLSVAKYMRTKAQRSKAEAQLARMVQGYQRYMGDKGIYPAGPGGEYFDTTAGAMTDPWGNVYRYRTFPGDREFVVGSFGPDMKPGVANIDDDFSDLQHPWRSNGVDVTLWTEFGYGDDIVRGDCTMKIRFPP